MKNNSFGVTGYTLGLSIFETIFWVEVSECFCVGGYRLNEYTHSKITYCFCIGDYTSNKCSD